MGLKLPPFFMRRTAKGRCLSSLAFASSIVSGGRTG